MITTRGKQRLAYVSAPLVVIHQIGAGLAGGAITLYSKRLFANWFCTTPTHRGCAPWSGSCLAWVRVIAGPPDPDVLRYGGQRKPDGPSSEDPLPASAHLVTYSMFVGDVDAGHGATPLPQAARAAGGKTVDGFQMVEGGIEIMPDFLLGG